MKTSHAREHRSKQVVRLEEESQMEPELLKRREHLEAQAGKQ